MGFLVAAQFLTCLPIPALGKVDGLAMGRSMRWFPAVGAVLGLAVALVDAALAAVISPELRAVVSVTLLVVVTGGLHMDGLMDSCDALLAPVSAERRLEILWDSRVGSFAIVGAATALLMKYAAILAVPDGNRAVSFVAALALSRWAMVYATVRYPVARSTGLGHAYKAGASYRELAIATGLTIIAILPSGPAGVAALVLAWAGTALVAHAIMSKIPGLTGDAYGAVCECIEIAALIGLPVLHRVLDSSRLADLPGLLA